MAAVLSMAIASACTAQSAASGSVELFCSVESGKLPPPGTTEEALCGEIKREIDQSLSQQTKAVKSVANISSADWIKIDVRFVKPGTVSAAVVQRMGGRDFVHPEIAIDVMDKSVGTKEVKLLAAEVARAVVKAAKA